jgi:hypothetical protein
MLDERNIYMERDGYYKNCHLEHMVLEHQSKVDLSRVSGMRDETWKVI